MRLEEDFDNVSEDLFRREAVEFNQDDFYEKSMREAIEAKSTAFQKLEVIEKLVTNKENEQLLNLVIDFQKKVIKYKENFGKFSASNRESQEAAESEEINLKKKSIVKSSPELIGSLLLFFFSSLPINVNLR